MTSQGKLPLSKPVHDWAAFSLELKEAAAALIAAASTVNDLVDRADDYAGEAADAALGKIGGQPGFLLDQATLMAPKLVRLAAACAPDDGGDR